MIVIDDKHIQAKLGQSGLKSFTNITINGTIPIKHIKIKYKI